MYIYVHVPDIRNWNYFLTKDIAWNQIGNTNKLR